MLDILARHGEDEDRVLQWNVQIACLQGIWKKEM